MASSVDRLDTELLGGTTKIRQSDRRIRIQDMWQVVWWLESASRDPIDPRSPYIDRRHMDESSKLCDREDTSVFGVFS